jgi:kynurenine formamidase
MSPAAAEAGLARVLLLIGALPLIACAAAPRPLWEHELVDLTHTFDEHTIYWPTENDFEMTTRSAGTTDKGYYYEAHSVSTAEHGGTHLDAPVHFFEGGATTDRVPLERLIAPGVVVDVSGACARDRDYRVGIADFEAWEQVHGVLRAGTIVLLRTGFARHWPDRERYMGTAERGDEAAAALHFPGLDPAAVPWLAERGIAAIGLDTPSIDHGPSTHFEAHVALFERGIPAFENVANLDRLPARGFTVIALPMKIGNGSGGPLRIVAAVP